MKETTELPRLHITRIDSTEKSSDNNRSHLDYSLGNWCFSAASLSDPNFHEQHNVFFYDNADNDIASNNHAVVNGVFDTLMPLLAKELNRYHEKKFSVRFWEITVGYWFRQYLDVFYDRYQVLARVRASGTKFKVVTIRESSEWVASDTDDYSVNVMSDLLNHQLFSHIIHRVPGFHVIDSLNAEQQVKEKIGRKETSHLFRQFAFYVASTLVRYNRVVLTRAYFSLGLNIRLAIRFLSMPLLGTPKVDCTDVSTDRNAREAFTLKVKDPTEFEALVSQLCGKNIPKVFLEGFPKASALALKTMPKRARLYVTANAFAAQELYKMWVAFAVEAGASKHVIIQHGGNYGHSNVHSEERFELATADYYMTSGWYAEDEKMVIPLVASPRLGGIGDYEKHKPKLSPKGKFLWVLASLPRYQYTQWSAPQGPAFLSYLDDQKNFVTSLKKEALNTLLCRPYNYEYGWNDLKYIDSTNEKFSVDILRKPLREMIVKSKLAIFTYDSTSMMESMALNVPTICYWIPSSWAWRPSAQNLLMAMKEVSIFHASGKEAAEFLNTLQEDCMLFDWWNSTKVQLVRSQYCKEYALTRDKEYTLWSDFFNRI